MTSQHDVFRRSPGLPIGIALVAVGALMFAAKIVWRDGAAIPFWPISGVAVLVVGVFVVWSAAHHQPPIVEQDVDEEETDLATDHETAVVDDWQSGGDFDAD